MAPRQSIRPLGHRLFQYKRSSRQSAKTSRNRENNPLGSQTNPAHVLNHDTPRGWAVIQKAVDDFDNDEIEGVKSDMDTLLVFNGLFSAVLSAFFVIAIALLQEDIPGATLMTLRQMSAQNANYTIQGNFIHSISPAPTSSPPFEPTANAIRINGLWTASLAISLITASFAILVKQWLREYMKFVTSFPQGRLRIRKFRRAGLKTWKVLTIAACLPLLLQLALGLFFIGLCFYTADLHSSVRNTTLPLVAGWGFIFFFVTVSPLFSDHCPYKTPALDSLVVALRRSVRNRWKVLLQSMCNHARRIIWDSSLRGRMADAVFRWAEKHHDHLNSPAEPYDEVTAAKHEAGDLDIMADADELQGNDEILGTAMVDALQLITAPPEGIIGFVLKILQHRVPWEGSFKSSPQIIDCSMATTRTLDSVHSILKQHLRINDVLIPSDTNFELGPVASWTAALYLSLWTHRRFENLQAPLWEAFNMKPEVFAKVAVSVLSAPGLRALLHLTCHSCRESKFDLAQSLARIKFAVEPFFGKLGLTDSFESGNDDAPWQDVLNGESLRDAVAFLIDLLRDDTAAQDDEWSDTQLDTLSLIVKLIAVRPWQFGDSPGAVQRMTLSSKSDAAVVKLVTLLIKSYPGSLLWYTNHDEFYLNIDALSRFTTAIDAIATTSPDHLTRLSVLKVCESLTWGVYYGRDKIIGTALTESWRKIYAILTSLVQAAPVLEVGTHQEAEQIDICIYCLSAVEGLNEDQNRNNDEKYLSWRAAFNPAGSPIPDGFYLTLMQISADEYSYWRVRRLQEMTPMEREAAAKDIEPYLHKPTADDIDGSVADPSMERSEGFGVDDGAADVSGQVDTPGEADRGGDSGSGADARVHLAKQRNVEVLEIKQR